jgi:predicted kinase
MAPTAPPLVHLIAGSTGAGKTTYALKLSDATGAVRFSIDEWMTTLFEPDRPEPIEFAWMMERIGRCERQIWSQVAQLAARGVPAILDLGFTLAEHRRKFADLAAASQLPLRLHHLAAPVEERWARVQRRNTEMGETYRLQVSREMFDFVEGMWEPPTAEEMASMNGVLV